MRCYFGWVEVTDSLGLWPGPAKALGVIPGSNIQLIPIAWNERLFTPSALPEGHSKAAFVLIVRNSKIGWLELKERVLRLVQRSWAFLTGTELDLQPATFGEAFREFGVRRDEFIADLNLKGISSLLSHEGFIEERIVRPLDTERQLFSGASSTQYAVDLVDELNRILVGSKRSLVAGPCSPVVYLLRGNDRAESHDVANVLLAAVRNDGRMIGDHVFEVHVDSWKPSSKYGSAPEFLKTLDSSVLDLFEGNSVILQCAFGTSVSGFTSNQRALFRGIASKLRSIKNVTQILVSMPEDCEDLEEDLWTTLPCNYVALNRDPSPYALGDRDSIFEHVRAEARRLGLSPEEDLLKSVELGLNSDAAYGPEYAFERWSTQKTLELFPSYLDEAIFSEPESWTKEAMGWDRLDALAGLTEVKQQIRDAVARFKFNKRLSEQGLPVVAFPMNAVFIGELGTGKSVVAQIYAQVLKDEGLLHEGRLVSVSGLNGWDLDSTLEETQGSVLLISGPRARPFERVEVVSRIEALSAKSAIVLAGTEEEIEQFFNVYPNSRDFFGPEINFPECSEDELIEMFDEMVRQSRLNTDTAVLNAARRQVRLLRAERPERGARLARQLLIDSIGRQQLRLVQESENRSLLQEDLMTLLPIDVYVKWNDQNGPQEKTAREDLEQLIGLQSVKKLVNDRIDFMGIQAIRKKLGVAAPKTSLHMAFKGNPGTGKTEVARIMARVLKEEGILPVGDLIECGRQDIVGEYVGHTAPKVHKLFKKAKGSVLFIDEAYSLLDDQRANFGDEAIATIIAEMENNRDDTVVILAGYTEQLDALIKSNPGFASRINFNLDFPDYRTDELLDILHLIASHDGMILSPEVNDAVMPHLELASKRPDFGNGRYVRRLYQEALINQGVRLVSQGLAHELSEKSLQTLIPQDFEQTSMPEVPKRLVGFAL